MSRPTQDYLSPEDMLREQLTEERLLSNHLILALAKLSVDGCRRAIESAPHGSDQCRQDALDYLDSLVYYGQCG